MKICILGANGFVGSYLANNLKHDIIEVTRETIDLTSQIEVKKFLLANNIHTVINCAFHGSSVKETSITINLNMFLNFYNCSNLFHHFINIGSGAEFDSTKDINNQTEDQIVHICPWKNYDFTKNTIARLCLEKPNFSNLRVFGIYDKSEPNYRLFKKIINKQINYIDNRYFDYISANDFLSIINYYINDNFAYKDINCVYKNKIKLPDLVNKFLEINNLKYNYNVMRSYKDYTGDGDRLASLPIRLEGHDEGLKNYV